MTPLSDGCASNNAADTEFIETEFMTNIDPSRGIKLRFGVSFQYDVENFACLRVEHAK